MAELSTVAADLRQALAITDICGTQQLKEAATRAACQIEESASYAGRNDLRNRIVGRLLFKLEGQISPAKLRLVANEIADDLIKAIAETA